MIEKQRNSYNNMQNSHVINPHSMIDTLSPVRPVPHLLT